MASLPFSSEALLGVHEQYNLAIWPAQVAAYALGLAALGLALRPVPGSDRGIAGVLAAAWLLIGTVYHMAYSAAINPAASAIGVLFVMQGVLFLRSGVMRGGLAFRFPGGVYAWTGLGFAALAMVGYPLLAIAAGLVWPKMPIFGVAPAPTTIFTVGMLLLVRGPTPLHLAVIPVLWAFAGGTVAWLLALPADLALPFAGIVGAALLWSKRRAGHDHASGNHTGG